MPVIPGFQGRSRMNMNVPVETATPASNMGDAFANVGGQATKIGLELMAFRKNAADARDVSDKSLQLTQELLQQTTDLNLAREEDGSLNPEIHGWKDKETQTRFSYTEKLEEFWEERLGAFSKTAASPEARETFLRSARGLRQESILKGEAKTLELEAAATLNLFSKTSKSVDLINSSLPELTVESAANNALDMWAQNRKNYASGLIDESTYLALDKKATRSATVSALDNFTRNARPEDIEGVIFSAAQPKGYDKTLDDALLISQNGGERNLRKAWEKEVSPEKMEEMVLQYHRLMEVPPEVRRKYRDGGNLDVEKMANSLSAADVTKYLNIAANLRSKNALDGINTKKRELDSLRRRIADPVVKVSQEEIGNVVQDIGEVIAASSFDEKFSNTQSLVGLSFDESYSNHLNETLNRTEEQEAAFQQSKILDPLADFAAVVTAIEHAASEAVRPGSRQGLLQSAEIVRATHEDGKYPQQFKEQIEDQARRSAKVRQEARKILLSDPASLFADVPLGGERISKMEGTFNNFNISPFSRKYVSAEEIGQFKEKFEKVNDEGKAAEIAGLRNRWGGLDNWFKVMDQYVNESGVDKSVKLAMMMPNTQAMESFLAVGLRKDSIVQDFKNRNEGMEAETFYQAVQDSEAFDQFYEALSGMAPSTMESVETLNQYRQALSLYSMHTYNKSNGAWFGPNAINATANSAAQEIIGKNFVLASDGNSSVLAPIAPLFSSPMRAEGEFYPKQQELQKFLDVYSDPKLMAELAAIPMGFKEAYADYATLSQPRPLQQMWEDDIQKYAYWATAPDLSGLILRFKEDSPYRGDALSEDGSAVIIPWQRLANDPKLKGR